MERAAWLREKRRASEERMDTLWAPIYDENWGGTIEPSHGVMLDELLALLAPGGRVLDAACGTGKYWERILASGREVVGTDHSAGMLDRARQKFPTVPITRVILQDLTFADEFDAIICIDALELIAPEDWPLVLGNLRRALRRDGLLYFTVELIAPELLRESQERALAQGLPIVPGEYAHEAGYHFYPDLAQVRAWTREAGFTILQERTGDDYQHFLAR
jgi:cyclopropane fatty-acyl-phospholipid synthase-like methyltransferase